MSNEFGPGHYSSTNETADRPAPTATGKPSDRWFAPCDNNGNGGTVLNAMFLNMFIAEMRNAARSAGAQGGELNENKIAEAMARYASGGVYCVATGSANAIVLTESGNFVPPKSLFTGMTLLWKPTAANTDAATINAFTLGAKAVLRENGDPLVAGDLGSSYVLTVYDASANSGAGAHLLLDLSRAASGSIVGGGLVGMQVITSNVNYEPTAGTKRALFILTGGGAAGGGAANVGGSRGSGGSAGDTVLGFVSLVGVSSVAVTIGAAGLGVVGDDGQDAGDSSFGSYATAKGGKKGIKGDAQTQGGRNTVTSTLGVGVLGIIMGGGDGHNTSAEGAGNGGSSFWGGGGNGSNIYNTATGNDGSAGKAPGAGGGGADGGAPGGRSAKGGDGAPGTLLVLEFA